METLCAALDSLAGEPQRRIVILRGAGPAFCAGLDLHEAAEVRVAEESGRWVARTFQTLVASPLVTLAAAHGAAYGGGAALMACCDLVVAAEGLKICFPEVRRGLMPALAAAVLRERLGGNLRELLLPGEPIDAARARQIGLVCRVATDERLLAEAHALAAAILKGGPESVRQTKLLLRQLEATSLEQRLGLAMEFHRRARLSDEAREGLAAFQDHRPPNWTTDIE